MGRHRRGKAGVGNDAGFARLISVVENGKPNLVAGVGLECLRNGTPI